MSDSNEHPIAKPQPPSGLEFFNRLPWERIVTWAVVLLVVYVLRDFFFVVFSTFLICYFVRRAIDLILKRVPVERQTVFVQRSTTVGVFAFFIAAFVGLAWLIFPVLLSQAKAVLLRVEETNIQAESDKLLNRTVGGFLYQRQFADTQDEEFLQKLIDEHKASGKAGLGWWQAWPTIQTAWQAELLKAKTPASHQGTTPVVADLTNERAVYKNYSSSNPSLDINFDEFRQLNSAFAKGQQPFITAFGDLAKTPGNRKQLANHDFELFTQSNLTTDFLTNDPVASGLRGYMEDHKPELLGDLGKWTQQLILSALAIPLHLGLALLIAFLICFDAPNLVARARSIRNTRVRHYYDEIAPMLSNFGHLTGKTIESNLFIGAINTVLTVAALLFLGVENIYFLAAIVFLSSIVPVIGAVFACVVVFLAAAMQPGGSLTLGIHALIALGIIHVITSAIVAPRIFGKSLHLHPVLVLVILIIAEHFFGIWGLVLGMPVAVYMMKVILHGTQERENDAIGNSTISNAIQPQSNSLESGADVQ